jgi:hypothetical protein
MACHFWLDPKVTKRSSQDDRCHYTRQKHPAARPDRPLRFFFISLYILFYMLQDVVLVQNVSRTASGESR